LVVSNSSPLVYLAALDDFDLLRALFGEVAIPLAVFQEVAVDGAQFPVARQVIGAQGNWIHTPRRPDDSRAAEFRKAGLHSGESEALALALELQSEALLMDDGDAVKIARELGINVIRTTGIYRLAKQRGLIERLAPKLDKLKGAGFWLRDEHYRMILDSVGER
jgi:predicted nucleic acid-binding protein